MRLRWVIQRQEQFGTRRYRFVVRAERKRVGVLALEHDTEAVATAAAFHRAHERDVREANMEVAEKVH